jgi:hypothetical protein
MTKQCLASEQTDPKKSRMFAMSMPLPTSRLRLQPPPQLKLRLVEMALNMSNWRINSIFQDKATLEFLHGITFFMVKFLDTSPGPSKSKNKA